MTAQSARKHIPAVRIVVRRRGCTTPRGQESRAGAAFFLLHPNLEAGQDRCAFTPHDVERLRIETQRVEDRRGDLPVGGRGFHHARSCRGLDTTNAVLVLSSSFAMVGVVPVKPPCSDSFAELPL